MADGEPQDAGTIGPMSRLWPSASPDPTGADGSLGWRDDLRLFALTWAAGFLFFLIVFA